MKLNVIGFEITEGTSAKTGKPYSIGKLHTILPLSGSVKDGNVARGAMGSEFRCEVGLLRKIQHLIPPVVVEAETADVMRFGERVQDIVSLTPVELPKPGTAMKAAA